MGCAVGSDSLYARPFGRCESPAIPIHIKPFTDGLIALRIRAKTEYVSVQVFDLHFEGPLVVRRRMADFRVRDLVFAKEGFGVFDADPDPGPRIPLIALTEENVTTVPRDGTKARRLPIESEAEFLNIVVDARGDTLYAKNRTDSSKVMALDVSMRGIRDPPVFQFRW